MKRFIRTDNDRFFKLEGLMYVTSIQERYPTEWTANTKFDEEGHIMPVFYFNMIYEGDKVVSPVYTDIDEASQDRDCLLMELNAE